MLTDQDQQQLTQSGTTFSPPLVRRRRRCWTVRPSRERSRRRSKAAGFRRAGLCDDGLRLWRVRRPSTMAASAKCSRPPPRERVRRAQPGRVANGDRDHAAHAAPRQGGSASRVKRRATASAAAGRRMAFANSYLPCVAPYPVLTPALPHQFARCARARPQGPARGSPSRTGRRAPRRTGNRAAWGRGG